MAIKLGDFIGIVKRESRYGTLGNNGDQATLDILNAVNVRATRIWGAAEWKWRREALAIPMVVGTNEYTVETVSGGLIDRILNIIPLDLTVSPPIQGQPLKERTEREFYLKCDMRPQSNSGAPTDYYNKGMNAAGKWTIVVWPAPTSVFTMSGSAKMVLTDYVLADVVANNPITYFPNGVVLDALLAGVMINVARIQGMTELEAVGAEEAWERKIKRLIGEQIGVATDNTPLTSPLPDYIVSRRRGRRYKGIRAG